MAHELPERSAIKDEFKWRIADLYKSDKDWTLDYDKISAMLPKIVRFKGVLFEGKKTLLKCLDYYCKLHQLLEKCYVYANMRFHENCADGFYQSMASKAEMISTRFTEETAFIIPEILSLPDSFHKTVLEDEEFSSYHHFIENILRQKNHCLSDKEEELLAKVSDVASSANNIFSMFNDADIRFPAVKDENGDMVELTKGRYITFLKSPSRNVRKDAYTALYDVYLKNKNMLASCYYSSVKADVFYAHTRKYTSSISHALADDNIPLSVYDNLLDTVGENLPVLDRYIDLRKKALGLSELNFYDLYNPLVPNVDFEISFEGAKTLVYNALEPLGEEYLLALNAGFSSGWLDVYENRGKRGGAYSWGASVSHPFVLMNYSDTIDSLFTLAHEMGHAMHSYFTWKTQPYIYSGHKIFVAEVASTVNEILLIEYMLKTAKDDDLKRYLINYYLEQFRATFFRQTMFAEFEKTTHYLTELGEPLTPDVLCAVYRDLNSKYYNGVTQDEYIEIEWARIPHFYSAFYVYQYATGFSAAVALADSILKGEPGAVERYVSFLSKGNSEYSIELLKGTGIDMTERAPVQRTVKEFERLIERYGELLR